MSLVLEGVSTPDNKCNLNKRASTPFACEDNDKLKSAIWQDFLTNV